MMTTLPRWARRVAWLPVGSVVLMGIVAALREWWRKAELSADRAGLLACQDPAASLRLSMKLAGGGDLSAGARVRPRRRSARQRHHDAQGRLAYASPTRRARRRAAPVGGLGGVRARS